MIRSLLAQLENTPIPAPGIDLLSIAPELSMAIAGLLILCWRALTRQSVVHRPSAGFAVAAVAALAGPTGAAIFLTRQWDIVQDGAQGPYQAMNSMVAVDGFSVIIKATIVAVTFAVVLLAGEYLMRRGLEPPEFFALLLFSSAGMMLLASANDLIMVFLSIEVLSIPLYVLVAMDRRRPKSLEAGIKYFLLGAFASAILLYGVALVYGATGSTSLTKIAAFQASNTLLEPRLLLAGLMLMVVGFGFKVAVAPFHMWTPDVYQGAPTPVTAFMAAGVKAAGFAALARVLMGAFGTTVEDWRPALAIITVVTLVVGALGAAVQTNVKRLLAYSSIVHAGYVLMAVEVSTEAGRAAALFYVMTYAFVIVGSFGILMLLGGSSDENHSLDDLRGLASRNPVLAALFTFFLFAQAGIPLTSGFIAKFSVFASAIDQSQYGLVVVGVLAAVVAAYAYLRVVVVIYMSDGSAAEHDGGGGSGDPGESESAQPIAVDPAIAIALTFTAFMTVVGGVYPQLLLRLAEQATLLL